MREDYVDDREYEAFATMYPNIADQVEVYNIDTHLLQIRLKLHDGSTIIYDQIERTISNLDEQEYPAAENEWQNDFFRRLSKKVELSGISQIELSDVTGISRQSIGKYINGQAMPSIPNLILIARALNCSLTDLIEF